MSETKENLEFRLCYKVVFRSDTTIATFGLKMVFFNESYNTIRGMRYCEKIEVPNMPDEENCSKECLIYIAKNITYNIEINNRLFWWCFIDC